MRYATHCNLGDLVDAFASPRPGAGEDHSAHEARGLQRNHLRHPSPQREPEEIDLFQAQRPNERDGVTAHLLDARRNRAARGADAPVVEGDHSMLGRDAVDHPRVPVIEDRSEMVQEDDRHAGLGTELAVGERHAADVDRAGRHVLPRQRAHRLTAWAASHCACRAGYNVVRSLARAALTISLVASASTSSASASMAVTICVCHRLRTDLLRVHTGGHVGVDEPGVYGDDESALVSKLDSKPVGERPGGRLRRAVGRDLGHRDEREHRQDVHQCTTAVVVQGRCEGSRDPEGAEEVRLHLGPRRVDGVRCQRRRASADTRVVDHDRHVATRRRRVVDVVGAGHVELDRDDGGIRDARRVTSAAIDLGPGIEERLRDGGPEPAVGPRDECR